MANTKSALKRVRQNEKRREANKSKVSRMRTFVRRAHEALESGDKEKAVAAFKAVEPELMRGVAKGVIHKNTAARKVSRLAAKVKAL